MCHSNFQRYQYSRGSDKQRICDCATAQTGWWHALLMLWWLARCRDSRDEEWQRTTQQEGSANTQSGRYLRGEEALQEFFSVKMCFICVYRPVVKVKAITWTSPPALRNVPKYAIKFFCRDKFFCWRISKKTCVLLWEAWSRQFESLLKGSDHRIRCGRAGFD